MLFVGIIPARYASTRFPGKPLADLNGQPVIEHVYKQAKKALDLVYVATDDTRIADAVTAFGGEAIMTSPTCRCGTERCEEAFRSWLQSTSMNRHQEINDFVIINIQGDEPFIQPEQIEALKQCFDSPKTQIATLVKPYTAEDTLEALENPNTPKVAIANGEALLFSRSVIPYMRGVDKAEWLHKGQFYKHIGMYAYRADVLREITQLAPTPLEQAESLEQLRWLENGYHIRVGLTNIQTIGIDTPEDLEKAKRVVYTPSVNEVNGLYSFSERSERS